MKLYDVCIIGAGASGMICAIEAAKRGLSVAICDKNKKCGNKLYATGNGKCNLANTYLDSSCYYNNPFVYDILKDSPCEFVRKYFYELGVSTYERNGYIYPVSNQASTVVWALTDKLDMLKVDIFKKCEISKIIENQGIYNVYNQEGSIIEARNVVIAVGGPAAEKLGAINNTQYSNLLDDIKVDYVKKEPSLCSLICDYDTTDIAGVRNNTKAYIYNENNCIGEEYGELQITDYGLSGIMIFNLSGYIKRNKRYHLILDFIPDITDEKLLQLYDVLKIECPERRLLAYANSFLNDKLANHLIKHFELDNDIKISNKKISNINRTEIVQFIKYIKNYKIIIREKNTFEKSQASIGGIKTNIINKQNFMIYEKRGLYAIGEALDVCGKCGGYNLMWAFISGYIAGKSIENTKE